MSKCSWYGRNIDVSLLFRPLSPLQLSEEAERGSSLFRRPTQRRAASSSPSGAARRLRDSLPRALLTKHAHQQQRSSSAAGDSPIAPRASKTLPRATTTSHLHQSLPSVRRRPSLPELDADALPSATQGSSSGSEALVSSFGSYSTKSADIVGQVKYCSKLSETFLHFMQELEYIPDKAKRTGVQVWFQVT